MFLPQREEFLRLAADYKIVPVWREMIIDLDTPISLCLKLGVDNIAYLLESVEGGENLARYSFIGLQPFLTFSSKDGRNVLEEKGKVTVSRGNPLEELQALMQVYQGPQLEELPRFYGGAVGFMGYDVVRFLEELPDTTKDDLEIPDAHFVSTYLVLIYDHVRHKLKIVANVQCDQNPTTAYTTALNDIDQVAQQIFATYTNLDFASTSQQSTTSTNVATITSPVIANMSKADFQAKVEQAKEYIRAGDIFQVVLSQRLQTELADHPFKLYRSLRTVNPAPYLFYLNFGEHKVIGSSPEMLVRVEDDVVSTCPIAGTRPRGSNGQEDAALAQQLLADAKERAEHLMLVDLGRNDLGKVSVYGTVQVTDFMSVVNYSHVMHLVSTVEGRLREELTGFDALKACFPAGTLSGAPKVRAMEIIEELEPTKRGTYGGAIGYFSFTGNLDTCITIRTLLIKDKQVYLQVGAGIVADSDPEIEYQECMNKAGALLAVLQGSEGGRACF